MNFNINGCECNFAGIALKNGLVSVEITPEGPAFSDDIGADGQVCRSATNECPFAQPLSNLKQQIVV